MSFSLIILICMLYNPYWWVGKFINTFIWIISAMSWSLDIVLPSILGKGCGEYGIYKDKLIDWARFAVHSQCFVNGQKCVKKYSGEFMTVISISLLFINSQRKSKHFLFTVEHDVSCWKSQGALWPLNIVLWFMTQLYLTGTGQILRRVKFQFLNLTLKSSHILHNICPTEPFTDSRNHKVQWCCTKDKKRPTKGKIWNSISGNPY